MKFAAFASAAVVAASAGFGLPAVAPASAQQRVWTIMPLGDSLTQGGEDLPGTAKHFSYRGSLQSLLAAGGYAYNFVGTSSNISAGAPDTDHEGHSGYTIGGVDPQFDGAGKRMGLLDNINEYLAARPANEPEIVLLMAGINDVFFKRVTTAPASTRLTKLVQTIQTKRPNAKILVASLARTPGQASEDADSAAIRAQIATTAQSLGNASTTDNVYFVDMAAVSLVPADFAPDGSGVHLTASGAQKIAQKWYDVLAAPGGPLSTSPTSTSTPTSTQVPPTATPRPGAQTPTPTLVPNGMTIRVRTINTLGVPISGLLGRIDVYAADTVITKATDAAGFAVFSGLTPGSIRVCVIAPGNRTSIRPTTVDGSGNPCYWYTFGPGTDFTAEFEWSDVSGGPTATPRPTSTQTPTPVPGGAVFAASVWNDANANGFRDAGEAALTGWRFTVFNQANNDAISGSGLSDANGAITIGGLPSGSYRVCVDMQPGWLPTLPTVRDSAGRACYWFSIQVGQTQSLLFGARTTGATPTATPIATPTSQPSTSVLFNLFKFNDINANGLQDSGDAALSNWVFVVVNSATGVSTQATTDAAGRATINVSTGNYRICEINQAGWRNTRPNITDEVGRPCYWLTMAANTQTTLSFGNTRSVVATSLQVPEQPIEIFVEQVEGAALSKQIYLPVIGR